MTPFPYAVSHGEDLHTARAKMNEHGIRHLPVTRDGKLAGVLSSREVETALAMLGPGASEMQVPVWTVCTREPYVVDLGTTAAEVARGMANRQIGSALVTKDGKLSGIVTTVDICRAYAELVDAKVSSGDDDVA